MEKTCEFCRELRPVVYCKADAAHLCLLCDSKVHSANALSNRHPRSLICELCRYRPAHVRCSDHQMFMCRGCDCSQHDFSSDHQKRVIGSYTLSPAAKDLAAMFGFDLDELENSSVFVSTSNGTEDAGGRNANVPAQVRPQIGGSSVLSTVESLTTTISEKSTMRSRTKHTKVSRRGVQEGKNSLVLQQILELKRLELSESGFSSLMHVREPTDASSLRASNSRKLHDPPDYLLQHSDLQNGSGLQEETSEKPFPSPLSQLDHLEDTGNSTNGDSFWQCKSPFQSNQLWPQNMQDLGVCDELGYLDDLKMPDFDLTFPNFEEVFAGEQDPTGSMLDDTDMACSSLANQTSIDISEDTDVQQSHIMGKDTGTTNQGVRTEDDVSQYSERGFSHSSVRHEHSFHPADAERVHAEARESATIGHKEKNFPRHQKQVPHSSYKRSKSDIKKRTEVLSAKAEGYASDEANASLSF